MLSRVPFAPARSAYSAAKHALNSLTANVRDELKGTGVQVTLVLPGVVATDFGNNALGGGVDSRALPNAQPVEEVAAVILGALEQPADEVYTRAGQQQQVIGYFSQTQRS
jgi:short-subunit dehydrogenase